MQAAILEKPYVFKIAEKPVPVIAEDEVLVKTKICGICTSELEIWRGNMQGVTFPMFIGHEVAGTVVDAGSKVDSLKSGNAVSVWTESKGYAEYVAVKAAHVYKLEDKALLEYALGEPISCAVNGVRKLKMDIGESVCIVGCGFMGLIMLQVLKVKGAGILIAVDTRDDMLDLARRLGATHGFNAGKVDVVKEIKRLTAGKGVDIGIESAGNQQSLDLTAAIVRMEGKLEIFGFHQGGDRRVNLAYWNWMAFQVVNGHSRSAHHYLKGMNLGLSLLEKGKLNMKDLISHRFTLDEINHGFDHAIQKPKGFIKGIIHFN